MKRYAQYGYLSCRLPRSPVTWKRTPAPHHVPKECADKCKREFDQGWDKLREETFGVLRQLTGEDFWQKLRYIRGKPVKRGLCACPEDWEWSTLRQYATGCAGA